MRADCCIRNKHLVSDLARHTCVDYTPPQTPRLLPLGFKPLLEGLAGPTKSQPEVGQNTK